MHVQSFGTKFFLRDSLTLIVDRQFRIEYRTKAPMETLITDACAERLIHVILPPMYDFNRYVLSDGC